MTIKQIARRPETLPDNICSGNGYRISILTSRLVRLEYQKDNQFVDAATQSVLNRDFPKTEFLSEESDTALIIRTEYLEVVYDKKPFSENGLVIKVKDHHQAVLSTWHYGCDEEGNLMGTARTLDGADGAITLEKGLLSRQGFSVIDDSHSLLLTEEFIEERRTEGSDLYFFGYGKEYLDCLKDFYYLCGPVPMIPKYALGNWWSRFHAYTEHSYLELLEKFEQEQIPLSVAVIDMDWHLTQVDEKYGSGWTGYTWNKDYFPDPKRFLNELHRKGLHTTLNLHPADGVRAFEEMYPEMARYMGIDPLTEERIPFDFANEHFIEAYFEVLHHPREAEGVDFWWIDWQQGTTSRIKNLDPLWTLNHYHYLDIKRTGKRPLIFSRYAGIGSHRYPIGFSGDSIATWETLQFQPYFTKTASNVGYGWWSHDIGGHMHGEKNCEMMIRWIQFGVFSPIMRLHSSGNKFFVKEPWNLPIEYRTVMGEFMRLRHRLIPYIYTMNEAAYRNGRPLIQPLYYQWNHEDAAYEYPNEYYFGSELIVSPITQPNNPVTRMGSVRTYIPRGRHVDILTGHIYQGEQEIELFREIATLPVLLKAGGIVPMYPENQPGSVESNPSVLEIYVCPGEDGLFELYEDDGISECYKTGKFCRTQIRLCWRLKKALEILASQGNLKLIPEKRSYVLHFLGVQNPLKVSCYVDGENTAIKTSYLKKRNEFIAELPYASVKSNLTLTFEEVELADNPILDNVFEVLERAWIPYDLKEEAYRWITQHYSDASKYRGQWDQMRKELLAIGIENDVLLALKEI